MNRRVFKLWDQANIRHTNDYALSGKPREEWRSIPDLFAELIVRECVRECINTLEFHGFDDAVPYIKWMATNKLGVEQ